MSLRIVVLCALVALGAGNNATPDPTEYCTPHQYAVTQVGIEGNVKSGVAVGGMHRIFSTYDFINKKFYTNYTQTLLDTSDTDNDDVLDTQGYEVIIDIPQNAMYNIRKGRCDKFPVPTEIEKRLTRCLSDKMKYQGRSYIGAFKSSDKAIPSDTFTMMVGKNDNGEGGIDGLIGHISMSFVEVDDPTRKPDDPREYLPAREEMIGSITIPGSEPGSLSYVYSSDFVDYQDEIDKTKFRVPDYCPTEYTADENGRSRRALSADHFRLARFSDVFLAFEL